MSEKPLGQPAKIIATVSYRCLEQPNRERNFHGIIFNVDFLLAFNWQLLPGIGPIQKKLTHTVSKNNIKEEVKNLYAEFCQFL